MKSCERRLDAGVIDRIIYIIMAELKSSATAMLSKSFYRVFFFVPFLLDSDRRKSIIYLFIYSSV